MNYNTRLKKIENKLFIRKKGLNFLELLKPELVYKGKTFNEFDEMINSLNIVNIPESINDEQIRILLEKHLISIMSVVTQEFRTKVSNEMQRMI